MKQLSDCRVPPVDDAKANLEILVGGLKAGHKLSLALRKLSRHSQEMPNSQHRTSNAQHPMFGCVLPPLDVRGWMLVVRCFKEVST
jgi:hypothetical protein